MTRNTGRLVLWFLLFVLVTPTFALNELPQGFVQRVEQGWLPELCVKQNNPEMPKPVTRDWMKPRAGGPMRILFICNSGQQFEAMALARSFDFECDLLPLWAAYSGKENTSDPDTMNLLRYYLGNRRYDAIAMASAYLCALPTDCAQRLAELIQNDGVGFVYALPGIIPRVPDMQGKPSPILDPLMPLSIDLSGYKPVSRTLLPEGDHPLSRNSAFTEMKWVSDTDSSPAADATILLRSERKERVLAATVSRGKGRIVAYNRCLGEAIYGYSFLPYGCVFSNTTQTFEEMGKPTRWMAGLEYADQFYGWLGRVILWAAKKEPLVSISNVEIKTGKVSFVVTNTSDDHVKGVIRGIVRSSLNSHQKTFESTLSLQPKSTRSVTAVLPQTGYLGDHLIDLFVVNNQTKVLDWSSSTFKVNGSLKVDYQQDFALHLPDLDVTVPLVITGSSKTSGGNVRAEVFDLDGRLLLNQASQIVLPPKEPTKVLLTLPLRKTGIHSRMANLRITTRVGNESVETRDQLLIRQDPDWQSLHIMAYAGFEMDGHPSIQSMAESLRKMGHDTLLASYAVPARFWYTTESGYRPVALWIAPFESPPEQVKANLQWIRKFSPVLYEAQDEPELQFTTCAEARFTSPMDMDRFRKYLRAKYQTLETLNSAWGTKYVTWEEIQRFLWYEVANTDNWTSWFDSRRDLDHRFVEGFGTSADVLHELEPDRAMGINPRSVETFGSTDVRALSRRLGAMSLYTDFCARFPMGYLHFGSRWVKVLQSHIGYTWPSSPGAERITREAWDAVRHGVKHVSWFAPFCDESPPNGRFSYLAGDLTPNAKGKVIAKVNQQLLSGPGDVAVTSNQLREGIFIYYPRSLFYSFTMSHMKRQLNTDPKLNPATLTGMGPWMEQLPCDFLHHLRALGYQYEFGDEDDLTAERLKETRVVFLSHVICLGTRELNLLRDFVKNGGCVLAEAGTGRRDESGRVYLKTPEAFREIFGIERPSPNLSPIVEKEEIRATGAELMKGISPLLGPVYQKGKAFFANFKIPPTMEAFSAVSQMLDESGIKPTYPLRDNYIEYDSNNLIASQVIRTRGNLSYLFLTGDGNHRDNSFCIDLPRPQSVYDMLEDQNLGVRQRLAGEIRYGQVKVFALSPSPAKSVMLNCQRKVCQPGESIEIEVQVTVQQGDASDRVVLLGTTVQEGLLPFMPRNVILDQGRAKFTLYIPLNQHEGVLEINARDLSSGLKTKCQIKIAGA